MDNADEYFMGYAIDDALEAYRRDEVPVGAVVVHNGEIISHGYNKRESEKNPFDHAEMIAMRQAAEKLGGWRLIGCTLYVTLEPCCMCAGAVINARVPRVVFGAYDHRFGGLGSVFDINDGRLNHRADVTGGVRESECSSLLSRYFKEKRIKKNGMYERE